MIEFNVDVDVQVACHDILCYFFFLKGAAMCKDKSWICHAICILAQQKPIWKLKSKLFFSTGFIYEATYLSDILLESIILWNFK